MRDPKGLLYPDTDASFVLKTISNLVITTSILNRTIFITRTMVIVERRWVYLPPSTTRNLTRARHVLADVVSGLSNPRNSYFFLRTRMVSIARSKRKIYERGETERCRSDTRESPFIANYQSGTSYSPDNLLESRLGMWFFREITHVGENDMSDHACPSCFLVNHRIRNGMCSRRGLLGSLCRLSLENSVSRRVSKNTIIVRIALSFFLTFFSFLWARSARHLLVPFARSTTPQFLATSRIISRRG